MLWLLILAYGIFALLLLRGITRLPLRRERTDFRVTVIVSAHNEANRIQPLLDCLAKIDYPADQWEVVIVDDRSTDDTARLVLKAAETNPRVRLMQVAACPPEVAPKKYAILSAINATEGDIIVTTDADCRPGPGWLKSMVGAFRKDIGVVLGFSPIIGSPENTKFLPGFQWLDSLSLAATAAGATGWRRGVTACGRNFAYRRQAYEQADGFGSTITLGSGDDDLLMHRILGRLTWRIGYAQGERAAVPTAPAATWGELFQARIRHASKMRHYPLNVQALGLLLFLVNIAVATSIVGVLLGYAGPSAVIFLAVKALLDFLILRRASALLIPGPGLSWFPVAFALHPFYLIGVGLLGLREQYRWKDREFGA